MAGHRDLSLTRRAPFACGTNFYVYYRDFVNAANTPSQSTLAHLTMRLVLLPFAQEFRFLNVGHHVRRGRSSRQRR